MHISYTGKRTFCSAPTMPFSLLKYCAPPTPRYVQDQKKIVGQDHFRENVVGC